MSLRSTERANPLRCSAGGNGTTMSKLSCLSASASVVLMSVETPVFAASQILSPILPLNALMSRL